MEFLDNLSDQVKLTITIDGDVVTIDKIIVEKKGKGYGTDVLTDLTDWADDNGKTIAVTPTKDYGGSMVKLNRLFKRFGFEKNKDEDIAAKLVRKPDLDDEEESSEED